MVNRQDLLASSDQRMVARKPKLILTRPARQFSDAAQADLIQRIGQYCTVLAALADDEVIQTAASGTLVTVSGRGCLLTAHHVLYGKPKRQIKGILDFDRVGIFSNRSERQPTFPRVWFIDVPIGIPGMAGEPDLAALVLPDQVMSEFNAMGKKFYNLDLLKATSAKDTMMRDRAEMVLAGAPWEAIATTSSGVEMTFLLGHVLQAVESQRRGFTFMKVGIGYTPPANPPKDFAGVSGGGLWVVPATTASDGRLEVSGAPVLAGVAFMQNVRGGMVKSIRCHGAQDIYGLAREVISKTLNERQLWTGAP